MAGAHGWRKLPWPLISRYAASSQIAFIQKRSIWKRLAPAHGVGMRIAESEAQLCLFTPSRTIIAGLCIVLAGCVTQSAIQFSGRYDPVRHHLVQIEPCIDRTGFHGQRDLSVEATESLTKKLMQSKVFTISDAGQLVLACEIERFAEPLCWVNPTGGARACCLSSKPPEACGRIIMKRGRRTMIAAPSCSCFSTKAITTVICGFQACRNRMSESDLDMGEQSTPNHASVPFFSIFPEFQDIR